MGSLMKWLMTGALGAGAMWLFDPELGRRRQARTLDEVDHLGRRASRNWQALREDARNRMQGWQSQLDWVARGEPQPTNEQLEARVRAALGRTVSHPGAIEVKADFGHIALTGMVLPEEADLAVTTVQLVRGVSGVENRLEIAHDPERVPSMQGGRKRTGMAPDVMQRHWAPTTRAILGAVGGVLAMRGARRGPLGLPLAVIGGLMAARAAANRPVAELAEQAQQRLSPKKSKQYVQY